MILIWLQHECVLKILKHSLMSKGSRQMPQLVQRRNQRIPYLRGVKDFRNKFTNECRTEFFQGVRAVPPLDS